MRFLLPAFFCTNVSKRQLPHLDLCLISLDLSLTLFTYTLSRFYVFHFAPFRGVFIYHLISLHSAMLGLKKKKVSGCPVYHIMYSLRTPVV